MRARVLVGPAGEPFGDLVHERHAAFGVGRDHGVADAAQGGVERCARALGKLPRTVLTLEALSATQRLRALLREGDDELALIGGEGSFLVKPHAE